MGRNGRVVAAAKAEKVAILAAEGKTAKEIAVLTNQQRRNVSEVLAEIPKNPELKAIHDEARARLREKALAILESKLPVVEASWTGETAVKEQAQMVKALTDMAFPRWGEVGGAGGPAPAVSINFADPATVAAFANALQQLNQPIDVTPKRDRDDE